MQEALESSSSIDNNKSSINNIKHNGNYSSPNNKRKKGINVLDFEDLQVDGGEDTTHHHLCMECRGTGELLMCDRCPNVAHLHCNKPFPLDKVPSGQWFCHKCVVEDKITARVAQYKYDRMHELEAYVSNPTALDIYLQESKGEKNTAIDAIHISYCSGEHQCDIVRGILLARRKGSYGRLAALNL